MRLFACLATIGLLGACNGGVEVGLNNRQFSLPDMTVAVAGCTMYRLGGGDMSSSGGGSSNNSFFVSQTLEGDSVVVLVMSTNITLAKRTYDEAFFQSGVVDELTFADSVGRQFTLRYWGRAQDPLCTPLELNAPQ